jgi:metal-dependent HD superfamily phosphatase/phosphodiesterase
VITDHKNLTTFLTTKVLERRLARWYQDLATFKFKIHYRKGLENARADAISRREDYMKGEQKPSVQVMVQNSDGTLQINRIAATSGISNGQILESIKEALPGDSFAKTVMAS